MFLWPHELQRNFNNWSSTKYIVDDKKEGNADDKFTVHIDGKDATVRETSNNKTARTLAIDFNKDARMIEIIGSRATVQ